DRHRTRAAALGLRRRVHRPRRPPVDGDHTPLTSPLPRPPLSLTPQRHRGRADHPRVARPTARGDLTAQYVESAPRTRGWSSASPPSVHRRPVGPAHAGRDCAFVGCPNEQRPGRKVPTRSLTWGFSVELSGFEPLTPSMRTR